MVSRLQEAIGPNAFIEGCITDEWREIQQTHLKAMKSRRSPSRWTKELIKKLWMISWDMWESRNGWVHREKRVRKEQISAQLAEDVTRLHALGTETLQFLPRADQIWFQQPAREITKKTDYQKQTWINAATKIIERDREYIARDDDARRLREFLVPGSTAYVERNRTRIMGNQNTGDRNTVRGSLDSESSDD